MEIDVKELLKKLETAAIEAGADVAKEIGASIPAATSIAAEYAKDSAKLAATCTKGLADKTLTLEQVKYLLNAHGEYGQVVALAEEILGAVAVQRVREAVIKAVLGVITSVAGAVIPV